MGGPERGVPRGDARAGGRAHVAQHGEGRAGRRGLQRYTAESPVGTGRGAESGLQAQEVRVSRDGMSPCRPIPSFINLRLLSLRYGRDYVVEGEPYAGYDRHNAEVAAFHLDRCVEMHFHFFLISILSFYSRN